MARKAGLKLRCKEGHWEQAAFELRAVAGGTGAWEVWMACDFGGDASGHWLAPDPADLFRVVDVTRPYAWPSPETATGALDAWERQQERRSAREALIDLEDSL